MNGDIVLLIVLGVIFLGLIAGAIVDTVLMHRHK